MQVTALLFYTNEIQKANNFVWTIDGKNVLVFIEMLMIDITILHGHRCSFFKLKNEIRYVFFSTTFKLLKLHIPRAFVKIGKVSYNQIVNSDDSTAYGDQVGER